MENNDINDQVLLCGIISVKFLIKCGIILPLMDENYEDEELAINEPIPRIVPIRLKYFVEEVVQNYSDKQFQQNFRISRRVFYKLLPLVENMIKKNSNVGRMPISAEKQLLAVLWILATPDSYRSVGEKFDMGKSSLSNSFFRVIKALNQLAPTIIKWPENIEETREKFYNIAGMDGVIGAIDGTYIVIKAPQHNSESYITRKCDYAITLQAICDASLQFTDCFVGYPGSVSDSRIFQNSDIYHNVIEDRSRYFPNNEYIIGDKAYPVLQWCIPPYINRGNLTEAQIHFNVIISKTRQTIERSFALLFGRFRRLKYLDMNKFNMIPATVIAACVLHNLCLADGESLLEEYIAEGIQHVRENNERRNPVNENRNVDRTGHEVRNNLRNRLYELL